MLVVTSIARAEAQLTLSATAAPENMQLAGNPVAVQAVSGAVAATVDYQFSYRRPGDAWILLRDFYHLTGFTWVTLDEGDYEIRVVARDAITAETVETVLPYQIRSPGSAAPVIGPTSHPLVAVFSAPSCTVGWMRVKFRRRNGLHWQYSPFKPCAAGTSLSFYVAGLYVATTYDVQHQIVTTTNVTDGPLLEFRSGTPIGPFTTMAPALPARTGLSLQDAMVLNSVAFDDSWFPVASDLAGSLMWYYREPLATLVRPVPGGTMLILARDDVLGRWLREIDLAGHVVRETNSREVSRQLVAMGHDPIGVFHHEALRLANGHTLVLASVERIVSDVQGPGDVDVYGEMVIDLDQNLQVVWAWNAFDWLDVSRTAILGETCTFEGPGCPALYLAPIANDWLHANSIGYVPADGNIVVSLRHQDWVIKIDYRDGRGTGAVLWRLGEGGDFTLQASPAFGPWPWFSHQHDSQFSGAMLLYDNGNTRVEGPAGIGGHSRGQVLVLDENAMTARLVLNYDLGAYSPALGSAERLTNGSFYFGNGLLGNRTNPRSEGIEIALDGTHKLTLQSSAFVYRSFRVRDLYRP